MSQNKYFSYKTSLHKYITKRSCLNMFLQNEQYEYVMDIINKDDLIIPILFLTVTSSQNKKYNITSQNYYTASAITFYVVISNIMNNKQKIIKDHDLEYYYKLLFELNNAASQSIGQNMKIIKLPDNQDKTNIYINLMHIHNTTINIENFTFEQKINYVNNDRKKINNELEKLSINFEFKETIEKEYMFDYINNIYGSLFKISLTMGWIQGYGKVTEVMNFNGIKKCKNKKINNEIKIIENKNNNKHKSEAIIIENKTKDNKINNDVRIIEKKIKDNQNNKNQKNNQDNIKQKNNQDNIKQKDNQDNKNQKDNQDNKKQKDNQDNQVDINIFINDNDIPKKITKIEFIKLVSKHFAIMYKIYIDFKTIYNNNKMNYVLNYGIQDSHDIYTHHKREFIEKIILLDMYTDTITEIIEYMEEKIYEVIDTINLEIKSSTASKI